MLAIKIIRSLIPMVLTLLVAVALPCLAQQASESPGEPTTEAPARDPERTSQEETSLQVTATICQEVIEREPAGTGQNFPASVEKLFCHTLVEGAQDSTFITHAWYHSDRLVVEVPLKVNSVHWRTWSSKRMMESWTGQWRVDILDENGRILISASFQLK